MAASPRPPPISITPVAPDASQPRPVLRGSRGRRRDTHHLKKTLIRVKRKPGEDAPDLLLVELPNVKRPTMSSLATSLASSSLQSTPPPSPTASPRSLPNDHEEFAKVLANNARRRFIRVDTLSTTGQGSTKPFFRHLSRKIEMARAHRRAQRMRNPSRRKGSDRQRACDARRGRKETEARIARFSEVQAFRATRVGGRPSRTGTGSGYRVLDLVDLASKNKGTLEDRTAVRAYLPMVQEVLGKESAGGSRAEEGFVYDVYCLDEEGNEDEEDEGEDEGAILRIEAPLEPFYVSDDSNDPIGSGRDDSEYDSEDSNAEDNPKNDYPDEPDDSQDGMSGSIALSSDENNGFWGRDDSDEEAYSRYIVDDLDVDEDDEDDKDDKDKDEDM